VEVPLLLYPEPIDPSRKMNNTKKLLVLLLLILLAIGTGFYLRNKNLSTPTTEEVVQGLKTTLSINDGGSDQSYDASQFVGKTALSATENMAKIETSGTGINAFITSINGRAADSKKNEFWELLINGGSAQVGAGSYIIQSGDSIQWHITTY
jgi:hypothetical protein